MSRASGRHKAYASHTQNRSLVVEKYSTQDLDSSSNNSQVWIHAKSAIIAEYAIQSELPRQIRSFQVLTHGPILEQD